MTEILAVVAVLAVLITLVFPALSGMRERGVAAKCVSQMRQQYVGAMSFVADKGVLPRAADGGTYFAREVAPYLGYDPTLTGKDYPVFLCPKRPVEKLQEIVSRQGGSISYGSYIVNPFVCGIPPNSMPVKRMAQFSKPSSVWFIADGNGQAAAYIWAPDTILRRIAYDHPISGSMKTQVMMLDGHAEAKTSEEMLANEGNLWGDPRLN